MAHYAELNNNNEVIQVLVVADERCQGGNFPSSEEPGIDFLEMLFGHRNWKQTSYNNNFRVRYAGIGYSYNEEHDAFIAPKPFNSWILNLETLDWKAPIDYPQDGKLYEWDEDSTSWIEIKIEEEL
jgi:hypothetical protein